MSEYWREITIADTGFALSEDAIRLRSYSIWQQEGCPLGQALSHWLQAKAQLEAELRINVGPSVPVSFVMPRVPISAPPNRRISLKIGRQAA
jgi:hypothetical protein